MENKINANCNGDRLTIQELALSNLAGTLKKHEMELDEKSRDIQTELKAPKLFLMRNAPRFQKAVP